MQSQPFYPLTILLALHPRPRTYNIFVVSRLFLAGLFGYLFFRLFLSFFPSVTGAISLMLSGYFILYLNISHLSVDVLIGAVFYSVERLLRRPGLKTILLMACILFLSVVGGMPETTFLLWCYGYAYALFRLATAPELRSDWASRAKGLVLASALGLGCAAFLMFPFLELMGHSFDTHQFDNVGAYIGLGHDYLHGSGYSLLRVLAIYLAPLLQGPPWQNILQHFGGHSGVRAYFGVVSFVLALIGIFVTCRELARRRFNTVVSLGVFFFVSSLLFWMKKFGSVAVNWIGYLPAFNLIVFPKYIELLQAMAIASLAAIGCSYLLDRRLPVKWIIAPVGTVIIGLTIVFKTTLPLVQRPSTVNGFFFYVALLSVFGLLLLMVLTVLYFRDAGSRHNHSQVAFGSCILVLVAGELCLNFLVPTLYILNRPPDAKLSPYKGAPYVDFLKSTTGYWRIFGRDGVLFPNWSEAFGLFDVRSLDAMYLKRYFHFIQFFLKGPANATDRDLVDRFIGTGAYDFSTERKLRFLELGSVRYLISWQPFISPNTLIEQILRQNRDRVKGDPHVALRDFTIDGETKTALLEHPPYARLPLHIAVPDRNPVLHFAIGLDSAVYARPICGGGVRFTLEARDSRDHIEKLYSRFIDPKHNLAERKWFPERVDLRRFRGQDIDLLFSTDGGQNNCMDWSGWADMGMESTKPSSGWTFEKVYDKEVKIYRFDPVLPRAMVFHKLEVAEDERVLPRLASPDFDIFSTAVVSANSLDVSDQNLLQEIRNSPGGPGEADIIHYDSQHVTVAVTSDTPGLLVLNDTEYPGWRAYVDGHPTHIVTANYLFRGVLLLPGRHRVEFKYQPNSFRLGLLVSSLSLLGALIAVARSAEKGSRGYAGKG